MNIQANICDQPGYATRITDWDAYSEPFLSVMPSKMLRLNQEVASFTTGHVVDYGCGAGKIIPFVLSRESVLRYTGVDSSFKMVKRAQWISSQFSRKMANIIHSPIEDSQLSAINTAISINSYYAWSDPNSVLRHIYGQLMPGSRFVLATINSAIDMPALLEEAEMELIAHPHWADFKRINLEISQCDTAQLIDLDPLIGQVREVGFKVDTAHSELYSGGLNLLVLSRDTHSEKPV